LSPNPPSLESVLSDPVRFCHYLLQPLDNFFKYPDPTTNLEPWQEDWLRCQGSIIGNATRQGGKSSLSAVKVLYKAITIPDSLHVCYASQDQIRDVLIIIHRAIDIIDNNLKIMTDDRIRFVPISDATFDVVLPNKSRIVGRAVGAKKGEAVRGKSAPHTILIDECRDVPDETFLAINPMMAANPISQLILISTPGNMRGFFYEEWKTSWNNRERVIRNGVASPWMWKCPDYTIFKVPWWQTLHVSKEKVERDRKRFGDPYVKREYECEWVEGEWSYFNNPATALVPSSSLGSLEIPSFTNWQEQNK
jgi:hypothetical protein